MKNKIELIFSRMQGDPIGKIKGLLVCDVDFIPRIGEEIKYKTILSGTIEGTVSRVLHMIAHGKTTRVQVFINATSYQE